MGTPTVTAMAIQLTAMDMVIPPMDMATAMPHQWATDTVMDIRTGAIDTLIVVTSTRIGIMRELITSETTRRDLH